MSNKKLETTYLSSGSKFKNDKDKIISNLVSDRKSRETKLQQTVPRDSANISCGLSIGSMTSKKSSLDSNYFPKINSGKCEIGT